MKLEGLTVNFLGDSITEGTGVTNIPENRYDNRLKKCIISGLPTTTESVEQGLPTRRSPVRRHATISTSVAELIIWILTPT